MSAGTGPTGSAPRQGALTGYPAPRRVPLTMSTKKDCYSAAGQHFHSGRSLAHLTDCPQCKFGTVDRKVWTDYATNAQSVFYKCADCGKRWSETEWAAR